MRHFEIEEQTGWTDAQRRYMLGLIGRGVYTVTHTLPDGRFVAVLTETNRDRLNILKPHHRIAELEQLLADSNATTRDLRAQVRRLLGGN